MTDSFQLLLESSAPQRRGFEYIYVASAVTGPLHWAVTWADMPMDPFGWLGWLVGWLAGWLVGWLVGWLLMESKVSSLFCYAGGDIHEDLYGASTP